VLKVREPGQEARTFRVPPGRAVDVGRDAKRNTLSFHDPTMSVQHLRLVVDEGEAFLLDLGSTNGVLHEGRRVESARLEPGDRFRAGMIDFELVLHRASAA
jgi:pSer/pThr/pTyr-binding forkhead associated (FHA) protein